MHLFQASAPSPSEPSFVTLVAGVGVAARTEVKSAREEHYEDRDHHL